MSAWILRRRTMTLNHLKFLQEDGQGSSSTSAKPVACCMHFGNCLIVVTRNSLRIERRDRVTMLLMPLMHVDISCKCLTWPCVLMLRSWEVACATAQDSLSAEAFKRVPSHVVTNVPLRSTILGDSFSMDLGVPTV